MKQLVVGNPDFSDQLVVSNSHRTPRPVPVFKIIFLGSGERPQKNALNKPVITVDETKHFFAAAVAAAKKCTKQSLPYAENEKLDEFGANFNAEFNEKAYENYSEPL